MMPKYSNPTATLEHIDRMIEDHSTVYFLKVKIGYEAPKLANSIRFLENWRAEILDTHYAK